MKIAMTINSWDAIRKFIIVIWLQNCQSFFMLKFWTENSVGNCMEEKC